MHLKLIDEYNQALGELDDKIAEALAPLAAARELLISAPGTTTTFRPSRACTGTPPLLVAVGPRGAVEPSGSSGAGPWR